MVEQQSYVGCAVLASACHKRVRSKRGQLQTLHADLTRSNGPSPGIDAVRVVVRLGTPADRLSVAGFGILTQAAGRDEPVEGRATFSGLGTESILGQPRDTGDLLDSPWAGTDFNEQRLDLCADAGRINVPHGSTTSLGTAPAQVFTPNSSGDPDASESGDG